MYAKMNVRVFLSENFEHRNNKVSQAMCYRKRFVLDRRTGGRGWKSFMNMENATCGVGDIGRGEAPSNSFNLSVFVIPWRRFVGLFVCIVKVYVESRVY